MFELIPILFMQFPDPTPLGAKKKDIFETSEGDLEITHIGHGTLMITIGGKTIHVDPWTRLMDYSKAPKADLLIITHDHPDHLDPKAIEDVCTDETIKVLPEKCADRAGGGNIMKNGDSGSYLGIKIEAVPAYNIVGMREGKPIHPKGEGNGYVISIGDKRIFIAGDTENIPEIKELKEIDIAFLPMNMPTMSPEMVVETAEAIKPDILYPYHFSGTDVETVEELLGGIEGGIEVRVR